jgi:hypothetical protein
MPTFFKYCSDFANDSNFLTVTLLKFLPFCKMPFCQLSYLPNVAVPDDVVPKNVRPHARRFVDLNKVHFDLIINISQTLMAPRHSA